MPRLSVDAVQQCLDRKFGTHSLPRLKIAVYASGLEMCRVRLHRLHVLTRLLSEESLARRVVALEQDLIDLRRFRHDEDDPAAIANLPRLLAELREAGRKDSTDWERVVRFMYMHPACPQVQSACLRILQRCVTNTAHKRAVVMAGGVQAIVTCLEHLTSVHYRSMAAFPQGPAAPGADADSRSAVSLLVRLAYTQGDAGHYDRQGRASAGRARDEQTLHLSIVALLTRAGAWGAIARAAESNALRVEYDTEEGYERQLARQNIESACRGLQQSSTSSTHTNLSNDMLQKRVSFICTCLASLLDDPSIGEPLGSILKQH
jgi:hypothetical protein